MKNKLTQLIFIAIVLLQFAFAGEYLDNKFKEAYSSGPEGMYDLAVILDRGDYLLYDDDIDESFDAQEQAFLLFLASAFDGYEPSQYAMGLMYFEGREEGNNVDKDLITAKKWFDKACSNGGKEACKKAALINE